MDALSAGEENAGGLRARLAHLEQEERRLAADAQPGSAAQEELKALQHQVGSGRQSQRGDGNIPGAEANHSAAPGGVRGV